MLGMLVMVLRDGDLVVSSDENVFLESDDGCLQAFSNSLTLDFNRWTVGEQLWAGNNWQRNRFETTCISPHFHAVYFSSILISLTMVSFHKVSLSRHTLCV
jgi:hypothetical protein